MDVEVVFFFTIPHESDLASVRGPCGFILISGKAGQRLGHRILRFGIVANGHPCGQRGGEQDGGYAVEPNRSTLLRNRWPYRPVLWDRLGSNPGDWLSCRKIKGARRLRLDHRQNAISQLWQRLDISGLGGGIA